LTSSSPLDRLFALELFGIKLGLQNIATLCEALGHPERSFATLHVAGTNGKGSVTAMAHAALLASGLRAARYISPHLADLSERFVIADRAVDASTLHTVADDVLRLADDLQKHGTLTVPPTFFEVTTAMAFEMFRRAAVDVAVIEVGLGGRFDATNVITPVAGAITTIGMDHQQHLGNTLEAIAREKAGIIKPGMRIVTGDLPAVAMAVVRHIATERGATLIEAAHGVQVDAAMEDGQARMNVRTPEQSYGPVLLALRGAYQVANALVAIRLLESARAAGLAITRQGIERGLAETEWPARLELMFLENGRRVLLDAAHNGDGAEALASYVRRWHAERPVLVISVMRDKDVDAILRALVPVMSHVIATQAPSPRALAAAELARRVAQVQAGAGASVSVSATADPMEAVAAALDRSDSVCVAGSIFLAGAVRDGLKRRAILH
jgi:dihydrofolate synthase/folylpolyglutamate synthase